MMPQGGSRHCAEAGRFSWLVRFPMAARDRGGWARATGSLSLGVLIAWVLAPAALAQAPGADGINYANKSTFLIPFQIEDRRIQSVLLHVSDDFGKTYRHVATAG